MADDAGLDPDQQRCKGQLALARSLARELMADLKGSAQRRVQITVFFVSLIGTLTWAFGDQILACGVFPAFGVVDQSAVICFAPQS